MARHQHDVRLKASPQPCRPSRCTVAGIREWANAESVKQQEVGRRFPQFEERLSDSPLVERIWMTESENVGTFVDRLGRAGILVHEPIADAFHRGRSHSSSLRTAQYRFLRATGLSRRTVRQIERARYAAALLKDGVSILDTVYEAGYSDQSHLTRSLKHYIGRTPAEIPSSPIVALHAST